MARTPGLPANLNAFLDMVAVSELGATLLAESDDGYNVEVGSTPSAPILFYDYAHHPGTVEQVGPHLKSTAAGRYQILKHFADVYLVQLGLPDFGPMSQDAIAIQMIGECHARADVDAGNIANAILRCAGRWASLPGAPYGQHENKPETLIAAYTAAGGAVVSAEQPA